MTNRPLFSGVPARAILALILAFGFCIRAATFHSPLFDHHGWRQTDTASIARAFAEERYSILYPQVLWRGASPTGYVETGLELHAFLVASIAKLSHFKAEIGRLLSSVWFIASCALVFVFTRRRYGAGPGLFAAYLYAFGFPLMLFMERAFMNEALLVCLSLTAIVAAQRYLGSGKEAGADPGGMRTWTAFAIVLGATALVGAIKFPYLIVLAPIAGLFIERDGARAFGRWDLWAVALFSIGMAALWYRHAHQLGMESGLTFGTTDKAFSRELVFSTHLYRMVALRTIRDIIGPFGLIGIVTGAYLAWRHRRWCEGLALVSFPLYVILVAGGNVRHNYYQIAIVPMAAPLAAMGLLHVIDRVPRLRRAYSTAVATILILVAVSTTVRLASFHSWFEVPVSDVLLCSALPEHLSSPADRVAVVGTGDPRFLFCLNRKGWLLDNLDASQAGLERAWREGARVALVFPQHLDALAGFLSAHADPIDVPGDVRAYRLR
ncbi:MAG TPA: hypothetical protein VFV78_03825 [Vicinamibacterales bacterium]|nr:hypothetical protein [Vicinamibacterales bacterium]